MSLILLSAFAVNCSGSDNTLKVYAVKYGISLFPKRFIFYKDKSTEKLPFSWLFYYIEYKDKKILVDTGFNSEKMVQMFDIAEFRDPVEILKENGINPDNITDIIITHSHFDHIGNADRFPNARIIINKTELDSFMRGNGLNKVREFLKDNPRVYTFDNSISLFEFFNIQKIGGHSAGSSVIQFKYNNIKYCLTGDEIYLEDNILSSTGSGSVTNHENNINFIKALSRDNIKPLIFHDNRYYDDTRRFIPVLLSAK